MGFKYSYGKRSFPTKLDKLKYMLYLTTTSIDVCKFDLDKNNIDLLKEDVDLAETNLKKAITLLDEILKESENN